uniref:Uncharacterized protein n=1 Tax=Schlesneria paludicola TaxID=360056 RepID=A0A7C2P529_9PLAN
MTRLFLRWMRQVLPRDTIVATAVLLDLFVESFYLICLWRFGNADEEAFAWFRLVVQVLCAASYGVYRVATFHPVNDQDYRQWLATTPWTSRQPLPMGPVHLVPQDLVVILASMALARVYEPRVLAVPLAFLASYNLVLAISTWSTGQKLLSYLVGLGLGGVLACIQRPWEALAWAAGTTVVGAFALRQSLGSFPWNIPWYLDGFDWNQKFEEWKQQRTGWPFDVLAPRPPRVWIEPIDGIGLSLLLGWWFAAVFWQVPKPVMLVMLQFSLFGFVAGLIRRLAVYTRNHKPPISFWGRISTLRPWQFGYDEIVIAPVLATVAFAATVIVATWSLGLPPAVAKLPEWCGYVAAPVGVTTVAALLLLGGPAVEAWRLTGRHRIVFDQTGKSTGLGQSTKDKEFVQTA